MRKIKTVKDWRNLDNSMNNRISELIKEGNMIIDYGLFPSGDGTNSPQVGYIKYCDKQFLRDYKIKSIMNEL